MTDRTIEPGHLNCPNCTAPMDRHRFESTDVRPLELDICNACHAIWFDAHESARLSADGVVDLFRFIHSRGGAATSRLSSKLNCARCRSPLQAASDIARNNRFQYHRCTQGHGRLTTFLHFLREKQFVRDLTLAERQKLAAHVRQIKCSSCGGPIDVAHHAACTYCGAAVSVLDKEATQKALDHYLTERQRQGRPVPSMPAPAHTERRDVDLDYLMFDIGTDIVGAFARMASRPAAAFAAAPISADMLADAAGSAGALPSLDDALSGAGLADSLSLVDAGTTAGALGDALAGDLGTGLADSVGSFAGDAIGSAGEVVADSGLVDLVTDGIGAIVEGIFN